MVAFAGDPLVSLLSRQPSAPPYSLFFAIQADGGQEDASQFARQDGGRPSGTRLRSAPCPPGERCPLGGFTPLLPICRARPSSTASYQGQAQEPGDHLPRESGARFVGSLGGPAARPLARHRCPLSKGLGVRGSSTPPVPVRYAASRQCSPAHADPAQAVVKLGRRPDQTASPSLTCSSGEAMTSSLIYGGESHFDNMRSFFLGNGFTTIVRAEGLQNPVFRGSRRLGMKI